MKKRDVFVLALILNVMLIGSIAAAALAQDSANQVYLPLNLRNKAPQEPQSTPTPTETLPPDVTPTPTETLPPGVTPTPTETLPPGVTPTPTETLPPDVTPTETRIPPTNCEQYGERIQRSNHFGVQMYWDTRPESQFFDSLVDSKAGWVRTEVTWRRAEPENRSPADYNWEETDEELSLAKHTNVQVIGTIVHAPAWAALAANGPFRPGMQDEFVEFVTAVVERYDGDGYLDAECSPVVNYWEFYNEPDSRYKWGLAPEKYADMLAAVYPAIKAANPNAQVVLGGVAQDWFIDQNGVFVRNWVQDVLAAGAGPYFDYMNIHAHPAYWQEHAEHFPGTWGKVQEFRQILTDYGLDKPMVITETGDFASDPDDEWLAHRQAITLIEILTEARVADVKVVTWFTLYDLAGSNYYTGLVTSDNPPRQRPAYHAFNHISSLLETANYVRSLTPEVDGGEGYSGYEFDDPLNNRKLIIAWTYWETSGDVPTQLAFKATQAIRYDIYGSEMPLADGSDGVVDGLITVTFGKEPIIIALDR